jgi:hypothetical protein
MIQPAPFIVEVIQQPPPTPDISVMTVINVLLLPFAVIAVAIAGGVVVGGAVLIYKRWRDAIVSRSSASPSQPSGIS